MASEGSFLSGRIDAASLPLAIGDVVVIALLLTAGTVFHNGAQFVMTHPGHLAQVLFPFLLGWVVAGPLLGAYSVGATETAKAAVPLALRAWILADVIGMAIRATPWIEGGVELSFVAVTLLVGFLGLGLWRYLYFKLT
ncbi:MAG: DUF3054 domain-containing protein [Haloferacaceae archaeon]